MSKFLRQAALAAAVWLILFVIVKGVRRSERDTRPILKLFAGYGITTGLVTGRQAQNHNSAWVRYSVNGVSYEPLLIACQCAEGQSIKVYYATSDPTVAAVTSPEIIRRDENAFDSIETLLITTILAVSSLRVWRFCRVTEGNAK
jgi:hypothetical protein